MIDFLSMSQNEIIISPVDIAERRQWNIKPGATVKVWVKVQEKKKTRLQAFEGLVIARKHGTEPGATFTVRKIMDGVGVERIFPLYSPVIGKLEVLRTSKVRRAKLYYIREKTARETRAKMKQMLKGRFEKTANEETEKISAEEK